MAATTSGVSIDSVGLQVLPSAPLISTQSSTAASSSSAHGEDRSHAAALDTASATALSASAQAMDGASSARIGPSPFRFKEGKEEEEVIETIRFGTFAHLLGHLTVAGKYQDSKTMKLDMITHECFIEGPEWRVTLEVDDHSQQASIFPPISLLCLAITIQKITDLRLDWAEINERGLDASNLTSATIIRPTLQTLILFLPDSRRHDVVCNFLKAALWNQPLVSVDVTANSVTREEFTNMRSLLLNPSLQHMKLNIHANVVDTTIVTSMVQYSSTGAVVASGAVKESSSFVDPDSAVLEVTQAVCLYLKGIHEKIQAQNLKTASSASTSSMPLQAAVDAPKVMTYSIEGATKGIQFLKFEDLLDHMRVTPYDTLHISTEDPHEFYATSKRDIVEFSVARAPYGHGYLFPYFMYPIITKSEILSLCKLLTNNRGHQKPKISLSLDNVKLGETGKVLMDAIKEAYLTFLKLTNIEEGPTIFELDSALAGKNLSHFDIRNSFDLTGPGINAICKTLTRMTNLEFVDLHGCVSKPQDIITIIVRLGYMPNMDKIDFGVMNIQFDVLDLDEVMEHRKLIIALQHLGFGKDCDSADPLELLNIDIDASTEEILSELRSIPRKIRKSVLTAKILQILTENKVAAESSTSPPALPASAIAEPTSETPSFLRSWISSAFLPSTSPLSASIVAPSSTSSTTAAGPPPSHGSSGGSSSLSSGTSISAVPRIVMAGAGIADPACLPPSSLSSASTSSTVGTTTGTRQSTHSSIAKRSHSQLMNESPGSSSSLFAAGVAGGRIDSDTYPSKKHQRATDTGSFTSSSSSSAAAFRALSESSGAPAVVSASPVALVSSGTQRAASPVSLSSRLTRATATSSTLLTLASARPAAEPPAVPPTSSVAAETATSAVPNAAAPAVAKGPSL